jgi:hypothetical protein
MKKSYTGLTKLAVVTLMLGLFSPSVTIEEFQTAHTDSSSISLREQIITIALLQTAEARPVHRQARRVSRRTSRRTSRRVNYRHNAGRYYGGGHYHHHHHGHYHGRPILAFAGGLAIGSIIAASTMPSSCTTVSVGGVAYRRCNNEYYQPFYQGDTLVYKRVHAPH